MTKLAITFDNFDGEEIHYKILKDIFANKLYKNRFLTLCGLKYSKKIGILIKNNLDKINSFNFENLKKDSQIMVDNKLLNIMYIKSYSPDYVRDTNNQLHYIGDFELLETSELKEKIETF